MEEDLTFNYTHEISQPLLCWVGIEACIEIAIFLDDKEAELKYKQMAADGITGIEL